MFSITFVYFVSSEREAAADILCIDTYWDLVYIDIYKYILPRLRACDLVNTCTCV